MSGEVRLHSHGSVRTSMPRGSGAPVLPPNPVWMDRGACSGTSDPVFFEPNNPEACAEEANRLYCRTCPVRAECLDYAMKTRSPGVWAGLSLATREKLAKSRTRSKCPACKCASLVTVGRYDICRSCAVSWHKDNRPEHTED